MKCGDRLAVPISLWGGFFSLLKMLRGRFAATTSTYGSPSAQLTPRVSAAVRAGGTACADPCAATRGAGGGA